MKLMEYGINFRDGIVNKGNVRRIERVMRKAGRGGEIAVGFLGGSITQGSLASAPETCYAYLVYRWWREKFPQAKVRYVNAGIGGTDSQFGVARAESDLLRHNVDFTVVEFSVNDAANAHYLETYEGLIRKIYGHASAPAVLIVNSVRYDDGTNAQEQHVRVGRAYGVPCVSMKPTIYAKVADGTIGKRAITEDDLHPNDLGHRLMAEVITGFLEKVYGACDFADDREDIENDMYTGNMTPISQNAYEHSVRYQNHNCGSVLRSADGFVPDAEEQHDIREIFRCGWTAWDEGARICFEAEGSCIGVQYRKSVTQPTPVARAIVDGDTEHAVTLDGNFEETWGDSLHLDTLAEHLQRGRHTVEIEITQAHEDERVPFYLTSLIVS